MRKLEEATKALSEALICAESGGDLLLQGKIKIELKQVEIVLERTQQQAQEEKSGNNANTDIESD